MAYTEKVSLSGTALSFLLYECTNSEYTQEGFLIGDVTSVVTNHISDIQSDNARLDTEIIIRSVLPLPSVSLFYLPTGRIKEEKLKELLSNSANEVVGWYKYRKNTSNRPTFRDKLIAKGLQKYFEKHHSKKNFVTCNLSNKTSVAGSTHTFTYRFGKINCFDMYEYIEDVTGNLGEKQTGYKRAQKFPTNCIFNKILKESNVQNSNASDAILHIQEAVDRRLITEAEIAAKNEYKIRELEAEIKQMTAILSKKQSAELQATYNNMIENKTQNTVTDIAEACVEAMRTPLRVDILNLNNVASNSMPNRDKSSLIIENQVDNTSPCSNVPTLSPVNTVLSYAGALKNSTEIASTSKVNNVNEDLITFDVEDKKVKKTILINDDNILINTNYLGDSSPEY